MKNNEKNKFVTFNYTFNGVSYKFEASYKDCLHEYLYQVFHYDIFLGLKQFNEIGILVQKTVDSVFESEIDLDKWVKEQYKDIKDCMEEVAREHFYDEYFICEYCGKAVLNDQKAHDFLSDMCKDCESEVEVLE